MARPVVAQVKCQCGFENPYSAATCARCGVSLKAAVGEAATVAIPGLEADPEVIEVWHRLRDATLGEYDIYAPIGRGGMATVFLALDLALEREVAIKVISPGMIQTQSLVERFKREARTAASLSHPNIIPVYAVKEYEGLAFFIMKYVDGRSLESIIRREGPLSIDVAINMLRQVGSALDHAHRKGVVHRDVKPANIMIDHDGWAIVTDFGIAKVADAGSLTSAGLVVGTPTYMSPEQFSGAEIKGAADQYSLGIMAYEMLTGHSPFSATTIAEMMRSHIMDEPESPRKFRADIPDEFASVVLRMLSKNVADRWPSIGEAIDSVQALPKERQEQARTVLISLARDGAAERPRVSVPISPSPARARPTKGPAAGAAQAPPDPAPRKSRVGVLLGGLVVAAGIGGGAWYLQQAPVEPAPPARHVAASVPPVKVVPVVPDSSLRAVDSTPHAPPTAVVVPPKKSVVASAPPARRAPAGKPETAVKAGTGAGALASSVGPAPKQVVTEKAPEKVVEKPSEKVVEKPSEKVAEKVVETPAKPAPQATSQAAAPPPVVAAVPAPTPAAPQVPAGPPAMGFVRIGSRIPLAVLYVDGVATDPLSSLRVVAVQPGKGRRIGVHADGCQPWDTTITVVSNDTSRINLRNPTCSP